METDPEPDNTDKDPDYVESHDDSGESNRNTIKYNLMPKMVMARGLSNRDGAKVVNAFYMDLVALGLIQFDERHLITESKIQREKDRIGKILIGNFSLFNSQRYHFLKFWINSRQNKGVLHLV